MRYLLLLILILVLAACAPVQQKLVCPQCPPPKPAPETARYQEASFDALPGWAAAALEPSLRAFLAGCPRPGALARACELARAVPANDELAARQFFEASFIPYALISSESGDAGVITGYYEPVELFFMQIQGSGQLRLESGERIRLGFADQNGHPFRSLGRYLVERGEMKLDQASMQNIKAWAAANPHKLRDALNVNPSYVFFRELQGLKVDEGPI